MTSDPTSGGITPASPADPRDQRHTNSASTAKTVEPASTAKPRSVIIPFYLQRDRQKLIDLVEHYMGFLQPTSLNRMLKAIKNPVNDLFAELYPQLFDESSGSYICLTDDVYTKSKNQEQIARAINNGVAPERLQEKFPYFTNPLLLCEQHDGSYCGPAPMDRITNRGQVVLTFEYDPETDGRDFFEKQIRWSIGGTNGVAPLDYLYRRLCRFWDFRQLEVVWSGNKSFHIHCLVDSRHLNPSRFTGEVKIPPGSWPEVPDRGVFRDGLMACWTPLEEVVRSTLGIEIPPDPRMREPDRYRRTPWGIRIAAAVREGMDDKNILGFPAGTRIPQIVTYSKGRTYSRAGDEWLLDPAKFFERSHKRKPRTPRQRSSTALDPDMESSLIAEIATLCEKLFGPPANAPFPVGIERSDGDWLIRFRNNLRDQNPGSAMKGCFRTILVGSNDPEIQARRYEFPVSANELVETFLTRGTLRDQVPSRPRYWWERFFTDTMDWHAELIAGELSDEDLDDLSPYGFPVGRPFLGEMVDPQVGFRSVFPIATSSQLSAVVSAEGASKTREIINLMLAYAEEDPFVGLNDTALGEDEDAEGLNLADAVRPLDDGGIHEHNLGNPVQRAGLNGIYEHDVAEVDEHRGSQRGFLAVACRSYEQAVRSCRNFNEHIAKGTKWRGVLLRSFDDVHKEVSESRLDLEEAARQGFRTPMEAAHSVPTLASQLNRKRHEMQRELGWMADLRGPSTVDSDLRSTAVIFTTHRVVQNWFRRGGTRYWIHPLFESWASARREGDIDTARTLGRRIKDDTELSWVLHDEISTDDLITKHEKRQVDWVNEFVSSVDKFESLNLEAKLQKFEAYCDASDTSAPVTFDNMLKIHEISYTEDDLVVVNPDFEPFGVNNSDQSPYLKVGGTKYYAKVQDWWERVNYKLTVTTTEQKIRMALEYIRDQQRQSIEADPEYGPLLRAWRSEIAKLGLEDPVPRAPDVPRGSPPIWRINDFPVAHHLPKDQMKVQIYLDDRTRASRENEPNRASVQMIYEEIKASDPNAIIIGNLGDEGVLTPAKAKGLNDFIGKKIYYVVMFPSPNLYRDLLIENAVLNARNCVQQEFVDEFDQIVGRTLGFRHRPGSEAIVIMSKKLWKQIGLTLQSSKYYPEIITERPW